MSVLCSTKIFDISNEISGKWKSGELSREARRSACCGLVQPGSTIFFDFCEKKAISPHYCTHIQKKHCGDMGCRSSCLHIYETTSCLILCEINVEKCGCPEKSLQMRLCVWIFSLSANTNVVFMVSVHVVL